MVYVKWGVYAALVLAVAALLHYSLPHREIVYVTGQEVKRMDTTVTTGAGDQVTTRDVNFIYAADTEGRERAYRNEDTDFGWPPYFKFDTARVSAKAENAISTRDTPKWMVLTAYGWRLEIFSMFENVVDLRPAESREETLYPWFNAAVIAALLAGLLALRRLAQIVYRDRIEPVIDHVDREWDETSSWWRRQWRRLTGARR
jgi:hypothetical protein